MSTKSKNPRPSKPISRRDVMRFAAATSAASSLPMSMWLVGCDSQPEEPLTPAAQAGSGGAASVSPTAGQTAKGPSLGNTGGAGSKSAPDQPTSGSASLPAPDAATADTIDDAAAGDDLGPLPDDTLDPNVSWWMQGNYRPVSTENDSLELEVIGSIPPELDGVYLRNGPNPLADPGHWFLGNGMVHGVRLERGKAAWYKNRYVQTPLLKEPPGTVASPLLPSTNVSVVHHASRLLALGEVGLPYELSKSDLSTVGAYDFKGKLTESLTAHPKIDPESGEMLAFAYTLSAPYLQYYQIDAQGALARTVDITAPNRQDGFGSKMTMMHDFQVTKTKVVFLHLPIVLDLVPAITATGFPFLWDEANGSQIGIMPRDGGNEDVVWIDIDPCWIFHTLNAYDDDDGNIVLEAVRTPGPLWDGDNTAPFPPPQGCFLVRYTIDIKARKAKLETLSDRITEFPVVDPRVLGRKHRYGYLLDIESQPPRDGRIKASSSTIT